MEEDPEALVLPLGEAVAELVVLALREGVLDPLLLAEVVVEPVPLALGE